MKNTLALFLAALVSATLTAQDAGGRDGGVG